MAGQALDGKHVSASLDRVRVLEDGKPAIVPWRTRCSLALNALVLCWVTRRVRKALRQ